MTMFEKMLINMYSGGQSRGWKEGKHTKGHVSAKNYFTKKRAKNKVVELARRIQRAHL